MSITPADPGAPSDSSRFHLLSNGSLRGALGAAGTGQLRWRDFAVTRWREDPVADPWGSFILVRDESSGERWSVATQPCPAEVDRCSIGGSDGIARLVRQHGQLEMTMEVAIDGDRDSECRRVSLANHGPVALQLSLTSYQELVLGPQGADAAHAAFSKMFVQTQWLERESVLLATRRRRSPSEAQVWCAHFTDGDDAPGALEIETDRARFLGRGRTLRNAQAMQAGASLSGTSGCVLDPVFALRRQVRVEPGQTQLLCFFTAVADSREAVLALVQVGRGQGSAARLFASASKRAAAELERLGVDSARARRFDALAAPLLGSDSRFRATPAVRARGTGGAPVLWAAGISGDRPIVQLTIDNADGLAFTSEVLTAQRYWQSKGVATDLVVLAGGASADDWRAPLDASIAEQGKALLEARALATSGIFLLDEQHVDAGLRDGLGTVARLVVSAAAGWPSPLSSDTIGTVAHLPAPRAVRIRAASPKDPDIAAAVVEFDNGFGGFTEGGRSYRITLTGERCTPAPWINVLANPEFGTLVSAEGGGYSWSTNSQQNALTPWPNDPVSDVPREVFYLRDQDSGEAWSITASPARVAAANYRAEHGKGSSRFNTDAHGVDAELLITVPVDDPVKLVRVRMCNRSGRRRRLSLTSYVQWALAANGTESASYVLTSIDEATGALFARNQWRADYADRVAFIDLGGHQQACTGDRLEFLGRHGELARPAALLPSAPALSGRVGAGLDPCGALQAALELAADESADLLFVLGDAASAEAARQLVGKYRAADFDSVCAAVGQQWNAVLGSVQVQTPDRAMDLLINDWLPYQVLGCRLWARTAYYQASGAYGFRDQLQDVSALCLSRPDVVRGQLLRAGARQFPEGDVQHWWLPPSGQGVRTHISDDLLWLPFVAAQYIRTTGDVAVLDELLPFLESQPIPAGTVDAFFKPLVSSTQASLYEHAARTVDRSLATGAHGLPLIGSGDWNDGMNEVGVAGRGESVWLAWFLISVIEAFAPLADARGDAARATAWREHARRLAIALDGDAGWDGDWYRRGYYDDGSPLGSATSQECRIDAIAQSWSVLSGAGVGDKPARAMASVQRFLTRAADGVAPLFTPPFDASPVNPGYIKGYPPGVRENGGQYTHGATWSVFAWAALGEGARAGEVFDILNPVRHGNSAEAIARYRVEPYVACADVYSEPPHVGRGGWTWYTGSAGWLYRAGVEAILGFQRIGDQLQIDPCIRPDWPGFSLTYNHRGGDGRTTSHEISVENPQRMSRGIVALEVDGHSVTPPAAGAWRCPLFDDGQAHRIRVLMGQRDP